MPYSLPVTQVGPESPSGKLLRQAWQPVATSRSLGPGDAQPLRILGEEFTLYRGESGRAYVVGARCAHRYTWLHTGRVEADCIRCFYHGWKYDGSGQCVEQPAEKETFASKIRIPAAAVQEYAGLVFASEPQWRVVPEVRAIRTGLDIEVTAVREGVERKTYYRFPNLMHITMFLDPGDPATECHHFLWHVPIDDLNSMFVSSTAVPDSLLPRLKETRGGRTMTASAEELMSATRRPESVTEEDYVAIVGQGAIADRSNERLGRSDVAVIELRKAWSEAIERLEPRSPGSPASDERDRRPAVRPGRASAGQG